MPCSVKWFFVLYFLTGQICASQRSGGFSLSPPECVMEGQFAILNNRGVALTCFGFSSIYNIYWTLTGTSGQESRLGQCTSCVGSSCDTCSAVDSDYTLTRTSTQAEIRIRARVNIPDGAEIKCSSFSNQSYASCRLKVLDSYRYSLPNCSDGQITVVENSNSSITCSGMTYQHSILWALRRSISGTWERLGNCGDCPRYPCPRCSGILPGYSLSRTPTTTTVWFGESSAVIPDGAQIRCSSLRGRTAATCQLRMIRDVTPSTSQSPAPSTSQSSAPSTSGSPAPCTSQSSGSQGDNSNLALIVSGWASFGALLIVILIVIVWLWRRHWKLPCAESGDPIGPNTQAGDQSSDYLEPISGPVNYSGPYDSLRMADVGQRSVYSEITSGGNPSPAGVTSHEHLYDMGGYENVDTVKL